MRVEALEDAGLVLVREGSVEVEVPSPSAAPRRGPARAEGPLFYNRAMELSRDVSVSLLRAVRGSRWTALDGLAGTGVRGVRYAVEAAPLDMVTLNDASGLAAELCRRNLARNGVEAAEVTGQRLEALLLERRFDLVDVDPFGSPARFLPGAVRSVRRGGVLAVTATDTPALCGSRPRPCVRRYGARPLRSDSMHEVALRILAGAVVREAARVDRAASPILSMAEDHYVRVFLRFEDGARRADATLGSMGYAWHEGDGSVATGPRPPDGPPWAGPLWLGPLHDVEVLGAMRVDEGMGSSARFGRLVEVWREEAALPPLLVELNRLAGRLGRNTPRRARVVESLRSMGYLAGRAHTNPQGIKTDAPMAVLEELVREVGGEPQSA